MLCSRTGHAVGHYTLGNVTQAPYLLGGYIFCEGDLVLRLVPYVVGVPVIASGGAGQMSHFRDALTIGHADAALAATLFHFGIMKISDLKEYLAGEGVPVRRG